MENESLVKSDVEVTPAAVDAPADESVLDAASVEPSAQESIEEVSQENPDAQVARLSRQNRELKKRLQLMERQFPATTVAQPPRFTLNDTINHKIDPITGQSLTPEIRNAVKAVLAEEAANQAAFKKQALDAELTQNFERQVARCAAKYEDYDDVVMDPSLTITNAMAACAKNSPIGAEILYDLAKHNRSELDRIARLPEQQQVREMFLLEAKMTNSVTKKLTSNAPAPASKLPASDVKAINSSNYLEMKKRNREKLEARYNRKRG